MKPNQKALDIIGEVKERQKDRPTSPSNRTQEFIREFRNGACMSTTFPTIFEIDPKTTECNDEPTDREIEIMEEEQHEIAELFESFREWEDEIEMRRLEDEAYGVIVEDLDDDRRCCCYNHSTHETCWRCSSDGAGGEW